VQANFGILEGARRVLSPTELRVEREMSAQLERSGAQLIVWPESAYPYVYRRGQPPACSARRRALAGPRPPPPLLPPPPRPPLPPQQRAQARARRPHHGPLRQELPDAVRRVHPSLRVDPVVQEDFPRSLQPGARPRRHHIRGGRAPSGPDDLL